MFSSLVPAGLPNPTKRTVRFIRNLTHGAASLPTEAHGALHQASHPRRGTLNQRRIIVCKEVAARPRTASRTHYPLRFHRRSGYTLRFPFTTRLEQASSSGRFHMTAAYLLNKGSGTAALTRVRSATTPSPTGRASLQRSCHRRDCVPLPFPIATTPRVRLPAE